MTKLGIVADDFTGGLMIAGYIEGAGIACPVLFDGAELDTAEKAPVVVVATRTRLIPADEATRHVSELADRFDAAGFEQLAYKVCASFDSTDEGNIGPVADLLAERYGQTPLLLSAGFPRFGTTMHQGYLFYRGRLVSESIKRFDPLTPMTDPDMVRALSRQTKANVGLLPHAVLRAGAEASRSAIDTLVASGTRYIMMDCSDEGDADAGAALAASTRATIGSDAHIIALAKVRAGGEGAQRREPVVHGDGPAAVLVGSVGPVATAQLESFGQAYPVRTIDLLDQRTDAAIVEEALVWAEGHIGSQPFAITTAASAEDVERAQRAHGALQAARKAERILAGIAKGIVDRGIRRLAVAGGETSGSIVETLGIKRVRALPESELGTGFCVTDVPHRMSLYLKPGKLGADDILLRAIDAMRS
ncbi:four-carbon acid sugar kinase family protein [Mesorhizobium sp. CAU 1732]|uniref:four-carbon acid sugar kinase family protein n=1 Tax=Mesorhizobium sp. CAU 1732 TaxID=3140358 RepID=UPI003260AE19